MATAYRLGAGRFVILLLAVGGDCDTFLWLSGVLATGIVMAVNRDRTISSDWLLALSA